MVRNALSAVEQNALLEGNALFNVNPILYQTVISIHAQFPTPEDLPLTPDILTRHQIAH